MRNVATPTQNLADIQSVILEDAIQAKNLIVQADRIAWDDLALLRGRHVLHVETWR